MVQKYWKKKEGYLIEQHALEALNHGYSPWPPPCTVSSEVANPFACGRINRISGYAVIRLTPGRGTNVLNNPKFLTHRGL